MDLDDLKAFSTAMKDYTQVVAFIRWQEAEGRIGPREAFGLLSADACYREYVKSTFRPDSLTLRLPTSSELIVATTGLRRRLADIYPELAEELRLLQRTTNRERGQ